MRLSPGKKLPKSNNRRREAAILDLQTTLITLVLAAAAVGWANWRGRKPYVPGNPPLIPYGVIQFVGMVIVFLMAAHLITLLTGKPFTGRRGY
ncbi:MAG: hypothetical protein IID51_03215 [Proteobacteria bacterium]|nr:hypothetical protein [Pseudomonadota bacterium]